MSSHVHDRAGGPGRQLAPGPAGRRAVRSAGRAGFLARGVVYTLIGLLAARIGLGSGNEEADRQGALRQIAAQEFGSVMLWALAAGFGCMALWRGSAAVLGSTGPGGAGRRKAGSRALDAVRAAFYASVCWGTAAFALGTSGGTGARGSGGQAGSGGGDAESRDWTAALLRLPAGRILAGLAGAALVVAGVTVAVRALLRRFLRKLDTAAMGPRTRTAVTAAGVGGNLARGAVFAGAGVFVVTAAVRFDPGRAKGMDDTLRSFAVSPAGPWLLLPVAAGLLLFGVFSFASARWRTL
ncbi:DUF1206 domain-containing protein [Kitasatospora sp. NPDC088346]|uniref:DUF1206 domain-containing protein n=1 Tax=Kitasatospora sp. NPDC088346 TaxID=3364073 RepID=UPI0038257DF7